MDEEIKQVCDTDV